MSRLLRLGDVGDPTPVVPGRLATVVVIRLHLVVVGAEPLEIDLVRDVRHEDERRDHADSGRRLDRGLDVAVKQVVVGDERRGVALLGDGELQTRAVRHDPGRHDIVKIRRVGRR